MTCIVGIGQRGSESPFALDGGLNPRTTRRPQVIWEIFALVDSKTFDESKAYLDLHPRFEESES